MKRERPLGALIGALAVAMGGCIAKSSSEGPQTIRETGYLRCAAAAGCEGTLCTAEDGTATCEALPSECNGAATCDCAASFCGETDCGEVPMGISCGATPEADAGLADVPDEGRDAEPSVDGGLTGPVCTPVSPTPAEVFTAPGVPVPLGAGYDAIGELDTFEWVVLTRPVGSSAMPGETALPGEGPVSLSPDDPATADAVFAADIAGVYLLEIRPQGPTACIDGGNVQVPFFAPAPVGLAVVVTWAPTDGFDAAGTPSTHLLAPGAEVGDATGDCHAGNPQPDWGAPGDSADDPLMGLNHGTSQGTTAIVLPVVQDTVATGAPYRVLVNVPPVSPPTDGGGPLESGVRARLQIYLDGVLVDDLEQPFVQGGSSWLAAEVHLEDGALRIVSADPPI